MSLTGSRVRAARALLRWSAETLAKEAKLGRITVMRAEATDGTPTLTAANLDALRRVLEAAGVQFIPENGGGPGVRLRASGRAGSVLGPEPGSAG